MPGADQISFGPASHRRPTSQELTAMSTTQAIEKKASELEHLPRRTVRAVMAAMTVVPCGDASGEFDVYSGLKGHYTVNLPEQSCDCSDAEYNIAPGERCKHQTRVRLALGLEDIPAELVNSVDRCLANSRKKFGAESEVEPITVGETKRDRRVAMTDGGAIVEPELPESRAENSHAEGCPNPECEGLDSDAERPLLSFPCWEKWARYDEEELLEEEADRDQDRPRRSEPADFGGGESTGVQDL